MRLSRKHLQHLAGVIAALWVFAFIVSLANGCAAALAGTHLAAAVPSAAEAHHPCGSHDNHAASGAKTICAGVYKAESSATFSKTPAPDSAASPVTLITLPWFGLVILAALQPIRLHAYRSRPVRPPAALLFLRLNN